MMMRRSRLAARLHAYLEGELDPVARDEIELLLERDARARALLEEVRAAREALATLRSRPAPPLSPGDAWEGVRARIAGTTGFEPRPVLYLESFGARYYRRLALAAALLLAVAIGLLAYERLGRRDASGPGAVEADRPAPGTRPPAAARDLEPFVEAGRRGGLDGLAWLKLLERRGLRPGDLRAASPEQVLPIADRAPEER